MYLLNRSINKQNVQQIHQNTDRNIILFQFV